MAADAYGMSPHGNGTSRWQDVLNQSWPSNPLRLPRYAPINVTARIVFATDGEVWLDGTAARWSGRHVCVEIEDVRLQVRYVWVDAGDVERR